MDIKFKIIFVAVSIKIWMLRHVGGRHADPMFAPSKEWVFGLSLTGIIGSNPAVRMDVCFL